MEFLESSEILADSKWTVLLQSYQFLNGLVHLLAFFFSVNPFQDTFHYIERQKKKKKANMKKEECIPPIAFTGFWQSCFFSCKAI